MAGFQAIGAQPHEQEWVAVDEFVGAVVEVFLREHRVAIRVFVDEVARQLREWGIRAKLARIKKAYFRTPVVSEKQLGGAVRLLTILAKHSISVRSIRTHEPNLERLFLKLTGHSIRN